MSKIRLLLAACAMSCVFLFSASNVAHSEVEEYPANINLVQVVEVGDGWIEIHSIKNYEEHQAEAIWKQSEELAAYTCGLYNRVGVILSNFLEVERTGVRVDSVYARVLVACALP